MRLLLQQQPGDLVSKSKSQPNLSLQMQLSEVLPSPVAEEDEQQPVFTWPQSPSIESRGQQSEQEDSISDMQPSKLPQFLKRCEGIDSARLCELLLQSQTSHDLLVLDVRTFPQFNSQHIVESHNMHLPALLLKRFRRGSVQNLNVEVLICDDKGKQRWRNLISDGQCSVVVIDDVMPATEEGWSMHKGSGLSMVMSLIDRDNKTGKFQVYWLKSGYESFAEYCRVSSQQVNGAELPNNRWLYYGIEDEQLDQPLSAVPATPLKLKRPGLERMSISISCLPSAGGLKSAASPSLMSASSTKGKPLKNLLQAYRNHQHRLSIAAGVPVDDAQQEDDESDIDSAVKLSTAGSQHQKHMDCSLILDWLILGADPAVIRDSHSSPSSPGTADDSEVFIQVPSPSNSRPQSIMTSRIRAKTPMTAGPMSASSTESSEKPVFTFDLGTQSSEVSPKIHGHHVNVKETMLNLKQQQVQYIVNLALECPDLSVFVKDQSDYNVKEYAKLGMWDNTEADIEANVLHAISVIEQFHSRDSNAKIYVHCKAGRSRSATVVIAYLMKANKWTVDEAYNFVKQRRPCVCPNLGFMAVLNKIKL